MRGRVALVLVAAAGLTVAAQGQRGTHLNPLVDLLKDGQPIFGTSAPTLPRAGGGGGRRGGAADATPTPTPSPSPAVVRTPADLAKDTLSHPEIDYFFSGSMEGAVDPGLPALIAYQDALVEAGAIATSPTRRLRAPLAVKTPDISKDPSAVIANVSKQLNAGVTTIMFVHVDNAQELEQGIAAMRFAAKGGTRPDAIGDAAKYWGLSEKEYREKADVWPLTSTGELLAWAIVETPEGLANLKEIAQVKGLSALIAGAGTLGGVFSTTGADGRRVRDDAAWEASIQKILATCKEFKKPCGYPVFATDIEARMQQGFNVSIIQAFNDSGFQAVSIGRRIAGRK
jgi:2-keto-3-deoxy-L-rhamnonate aldolase RhmA